MSYHYSKERDASVNEFFDPESLNKFKEWNESVFKP